MVCSTLPGLQLALKLQECASHPLCCMWHEMTSLQAAVAQACTPASQPACPACSCGGERPQVMLWELPLGSQHAGVMRERLRQPSAQDATQDTLRHCQALHWSPDSAWLAGGIDNGVACLWSRTGVPDVPVQPTRLSDTRRSTGTLPALGHLFALCPFVPPCLSAGAGCGCLAGRPALLLPPAAALQSKGEEHSLPAQALLQV